VETCKTSALSPSLPFWKSGFAGIETDPNTILVFFVPSPRESQAVA
jgi:hypothetical protein